MTTLRDPFAVVHQKPKKNKDGSTTLLDYVSWSQVADRLDEAAPGWAFTIVQVGEDWAWGRLTLDGRTFENIGYAENADAAWKSEVLKDAVSDALKRCAALAGVGRYLYDRDAPTRSSHAPVPPGAARPAAAPPVGTSPAGGAVCPIHGVPFAGSPGDYWHKTPEGRYCRPEGQPKRERAPRAESRPPAAPEPEEPEYLKDLPF